jgi:hypothetical protein
VPSPTRPMAPTSCPAVSRRWPATARGRLRLCRRSSMRLGIARRVHQAGDVPGVAEHEGRRPAEQLRGLVAALPRGQVVGDGSGDEGRHDDGPQVQWRSQHAELSGPGEQIVPEDVQELAVQRAGQIGAVGVPGQDVEGRRLVPHQVVVHPVVEHQVVWTQPGERAAHLPAGDDPLAPRPVAGERDQPPPGERGDRGAQAEVEQRHRVRHAVHAVVAGGGQVVEQRGGDDRGPEPAQSGG